MKIALLQSALEWENPQANRNHFADKIKSIAEPVDLIVLPEMFTSGFTMNPKSVAERMEGETVLWMKNQAKITQAAICGTAVISVAGLYYNRLLFVLPSGVIYFYDKRHLFSLAGEDKEYTAGTQKLIVDYKGFKFCLLTCYDLRFPVFSRNVENYDLLVYVANWPKPRISAWDILLKARSIENMCYTIGVNRLGFDGNNLEYTGHSQAVDCLGNYLIAPSENEGIFITTLEKNSMMETRNKLAFLNDRDAFRVLD